MNKLETRLDALTGVRGLAAWMVVLFHIRGAFAADAPAFLNRIVDKGYLAVDMFFVLSGFVMWLTYGQRFRDEGLAAMPDFLARRIGRVWPLHAFILLATVGFALLLLATGHKDTQSYPFSELPLHFLLVQNWGFTAQLAWNDPSWSISTEMAAYLLLPITTMLFFRRRWPLWLLALAIPSLAFLLSLFFAMRGNSLLGGDIASTGLVRCLVEFHIGVFLCMIWQRAKGKWSLLTAALTVCVTAGLWGKGVWIETFSAPLLFAALIYVMAETSSSRTNLFSSRIWVHFGDISYSLYLAHFLLWIGFKLLFVENADHVAPGLLALFLALTYGAALILYKGVEKPGRTWMGQWWQRARP